MKQNIPNVSFKRYLAISLIGFGLGGLLWGLVLYRELPDLEFPFHFMAIVIMGLFGGVSLTWFSKSVRQISKAVLAGFLGYGVGFLGMAFLIYSSSLYGTFILSIFLPSSIDESFFELEPNIGVSVFWLSFLFIGIIVGLFYSIFLKTKIWPLIWRGGVGFVLGSLVGPVVGNLLGNAFNSLLIAYLTTFTLIGLILGLFLSWGIYKYKK